MLQVEREVTEDHTEQVHRTGVVILDAESLVSDLAVLLNTEWHIDAPNIRTLGKTILMQYPPQLAQFTVPNLEKPISHFVANNDVLMISAPGIDALVKIKFQVNTLTLLCIKALHISIAQKMPLYSNLDFSKILPEELLDKFNQFANVFVSREE
eukprot:Phypoly_transcript_13693.p1 GENE.Phypoly_transcript_13693~~Phypoly_transcript_13693.p1  ORF type:complete len:154 (+),score=16.55 Phypoly_transcript_13693:519-980(+)